MQHKNKAPGETRSPPEKKFRSGAISATVWANQATTKEGKTVEYKTVSFERRYKDAKDEWQSTHSLRLNDLPRAKLVLEKAFEYLALNESPSITEEAI